MTKTASFHIHQQLLNVYGDQIRYVSRVRWWVMHFCNNDSNVHTTCADIDYFTSAEYTVLFVANENTLIIVVTMWKNNMLKLKFCFIQW